MKARDGQQKYEQDNNKNKDQNEISQAKCSKNRTNDEKEKT